MTLFPSLSRVTNSLLSGGVLQSVQRSLGNIAESERQISSGRLYSAPSDAPLSVRRLITWQRMVDRNDKLSSNISLATGRLSASESSLEEMENLIIRAREIALTEINASASAETRFNSSIEISTLIDESVTLANRQFADSFLFGGALVDEAPFERVGSFVSYRGNEYEGNIEIAPNSTFPSSISGVRAFNAFSSQIEGSVDLDPNLQLKTPLSLLNNGRGIGDGSIEIRDGSGDRMFVDLSAAKTVGDVLDAINATGYATASLNAAGNGLQLAKSGFDLTVMNVNGGSVATALGIQKLNMGGSFEGDDLDPRVTMQTELGMMGAGLGVNSMGIVIQNGTVTAEVDFSGATTVEDIINRINTSGTNTHARISDDGRRLKLTSSLSGAEFRVTERTGGTSAAELGLFVPIDQQPLTQLNAGLGVGAIDGADFTIHQADGNTIDIDVSLAQTVSDLIDLINTNVNNNGSLVADLIPGTQSLRLTDSSVGADDLSVSSINGSYAAVDLGILGSGVNGVLEGEDLNPGGIRVNSIFDGFSILYEGLVNSNEALIARAMQTFDAAEEQLLQARAELGGRVRRLEITERRTETETLEIQELISLEGDTDLASALVKFSNQQTVYQAALQTSSQLIQLTVLDFLS